MFLIGEQQQMIDPRKWWEVIRDAAGDAGIPLIFIGVLVIVWFVLPRVSEFIRSLRGRK